VVVGATVTTGEAGPEHVLVGLTAEAGGFAVEVTSVVDACTGTE
jgi:hypothetical protein